MDARCGARRAAAARPAESTPGSPVVTRMVNAVYRPTRCSICNRLLSQPSDPLSANCGGDCLACNIAREDSEPVPDLAAEELRIWLDLRADVEPRLLDATPIYHYDPLKRTAQDRSPIKHATLDAWHERLAEHGYTEDEARFLVREIVNRVWTYLKDGRRHGP